jgi:hypothetical protein
MKTLVVLFMFTGLLFQASCATLPRPVDKFLRNEIFCREFNDNTTAAMEQAKILSDYTPWIDISLFNDSGVTVKTNVEFKFPAEVMETNGNNQLRYKHYSIPNTISPGKKAKVRVPTNWDIWVTYQVAGSGTHGPRNKHRTAWYPEEIKVVPPGVPEYSPPLLRPYRPVCTRVLFNNWLDGEGSVKIVFPKTITGKGQIRVTEGRDRVTVSDPAIVSTPSPKLIPVGRKSTEPFDLPPGKYMILFYLDGKKYADGIYNVSGDGNLYDQRGREITTTISFPETCGEKYQPKYRVKTPYSAQAEKK